LGKKLQDKKSKQDTSGEYRVKIGDEIHELKEADILPDIDQNEIHVDKNELSALNQQAMVHFDSNQSSVRRLFNKFFLCSSKSKNPQKISDLAAEKQKLLHKDTMKTELTDSTNVHERSQTPSVQSQAGKNKQNQDKPQEARPIDIRREDVEQQKVKTVFVRAPG